jgi:hypothetical protein
VCLCEYHSGGKKLAAAFKVKDDPAIPSHLWEFVQKKSKHISTKRKKSYVPKFS